MLVEVTRGGVVESVHRGHAVVVNAEGRVTAKWGDPSLAIFPRSAIKPLQAIPLVESGALDAFNLGEPELALACGSHSGESRHIRLMTGWLARLGVGLDVLGCGAHPPHDEETAQDMIRQGETPTVLHNNCSGKHLGMVTTALHLGESVDGYYRLDHPVQRRVLHAVGQMAGTDLSHAPHGIDGCSLPTVAMPLHALAMAMARVADPAHLPPARAQAVTRIRRAWGAHAPLIGGSTVFDTRVMQAGAPGRMLLKSGAEGVCCAVLPRQGLGIALKIEDGSARAREVAMVALLRYCKELRGESTVLLDKFLMQPLINHRGIEVGMVRPIPGWPI